MKEYIARTNEPSIMLRTIAEKQIDAILTLKAIARELNLKIKSFWEVDESKKMKLL